MTKTEYAATTAEPTTGSGRSRKETDATTEPCPAAAGLRMTAAETDTMVYTGKEERRTLPPAITKWLPTVVSILAGLLGWTAISKFVLGERSFLLPAPLDVLTQSLARGSHLVTMMAALGLTTRVALLGLAIAFVIGVATAIAMKHSRFAEKALYPYAVILQTIPVLALVPLLGLWFGYGFASRTTVCVLFSLFPIISNTLFGLKSVDQGMTDLFTSRGASFAQVLWKLEIPAALPDIFFTQGTPGIGTLITVYTSRLQSMDLFGAIVLSALLGLAVFGVFTKISDLVVASWHLTRSDE